MDPITAIAVAFIAALPKLVEVVLDHVRRTREGGKGGPPKP